MNEEFSVKKKLNKTIGVCIIIVIVATIANLIIFAGYRTSIINSVSDKMTADISTKVETDVKNEITDNVLEQYSREYKIPDDFTTIGSYVYNTASDSVVEIYCQSSAGTSTATGMILNNDGYILTNAHVVTYDYAYRVYEGPFATVKTRTEIHSNVSVRYNGNSNWQSCEVIEYDEDKDLAVIKLDNISGLSLKPITFGDSDRINLGEGAVIIGNAYGLGISVTTGTFTNINPVNLNDERDVIQTDTAINSGNSGGPIFDIGANCMGIATYKIVNQQYNGTNTEGLGFALSSNFIKAYLDLLHINYTSYQDTAQ